ncbi:hypothetical protein ACFSM5_07845 [Lacibacterium aquatile]|uniref:Uncharacterized protein n=1 Tax=Lacibacterium aquatile TaxID=1168082 RepID=A0ABW5DP54_9PROT
MAFLLYRFIESCCIIGIMYADLIQSAAGERIGWGKVLILFPYLRTSVEMGIERYLMHTNSGQYHPQLRAIEERLAEYVPNPSPHLSVSWDT